MEKTSWNLKTVTIIVLSCLLAAGVLVGVNYLLTQAGVHNPFWYSFSKAVLITLVIFLHNLYAGNSKTKSRNGKIPVLLRMALSIVAITAIDLFLAQ